VTARQAPLCVRGFNFSRKLRFSQQPAFFSTSCVFLYKLRFSLQAFDWQLICDNIPKYQGLSATLEGELCDEG
jgi:hypothetical protein